MIPGSRVQLVPPAVLGGALSVASLVSAGLLLYGGPGLIRSLAVILATLLAALAAGVASGRAGRRRDPVDSLRRLWLLTLVAFTVAALFAAAWEAFGGFGARALSQGTGLALLGALPLFAGGAVLGTLSRLPELGRGRRGPASPALAGAAAGALVLGFLLFPAISPTGILLVCLVALSAAALVQGWALDGVPRADTAGAEPAPVRVERWVRGRPPLVRLAYIEGERLRALTGSAGESARHLDVALEEGIGGWAAPGGRFLVLGAGGAPLARRLLEGNEREGRGGVRILEGDPALLEMIRESLLRHDGASPALRADPIAVREALSGSPAHLPPSSWDLVFLDTLSLAPDPGAFRFPPGSVVRLGEALRPGGVLVVGPLQDGGRAGALLDRVRGLPLRFPRVSLYVAGRSDRGEASGEVPPGRLELWRRSRIEQGSRPAFLVAGLEGADGQWPDRLAGYLRVVLDAGERTP